MHSHTVASFSAVLPWMSLSEKSASYFLLNTGSMHFVDSRTSSASTAPSIAAMCTAVRRCESLKLASAWPCRSSIHCYHPLFEPDGKPVLCDAFHRLRVCVFLFPPSERELGVGAGGGR